MNRLYFDGCGQKQLASTPLQERIAVYMLLSNFGARGYRPLDSAVEV